MQNTVIQYFALLFSANFIKSATLGYNRSKFLLSITNINIIIEINYQLSITIISFNISFFIVVTSLNNCSTSSFNKWIFCLVVTKES